jgi:hypothetical protein
VTRSAPATKEDSIADVAKLDRRLLEGGSPALDDARRRGDATVARTPGTQGLAKGSVRALRADALSEVKDADLRQASTVAAITAYLAATEQRFWQ